MKSAAAGHFYWLRRGTQQTVLCFVTGNGRRADWFLCRVWQDKPARWTDEQARPLSSIVEKADPESYHVRRALQFADEPLTQVLLNTAPTKKRRSA